MKIESMNTGLPPPITPKEKIKVWMQVILTIVMLPTALFIFFSPDFTIEEKVLVGGWVLTILGFWS